MNQQEWSEPEDQRKNKKYPEFSDTRTPSGHRITIVDTKGEESVTIEHRSGSLIQFQSDGSIVFRSMTNKYQVTFGDDNMLVTGAQNITVNGGATLKVEGDYDMTVKGNSRTTVEGNMETLVKGNMKSAVLGSSEEVVKGNKAVEVVGTSQEVAKTINKGSTGSMLTSADGPVVLKGSRVDINPS